MLQLVARRKPNKRVSLTTNIGSGPGSFCGSNNSVTLILNNPIIEIGDWIIYYYLKVNLWWAKQQGEGWYDEGETANFRVSSPVIRYMPNTPCLIKAGMTGLCKGKYATKEHLERAKAIFDSVGRSLVLDEVTGLSASGPAFIYIVIKSLAEGGVKVGLPRNIATELASQAVMGSAKMVLDTNEHPALLKDMVTTPAGCTIDGILKLEEDGLRVTLINAVGKSYQAGQRTN